MDVLTPMDTAFLRMEDTHSSLHIGSVAIFDGPAPPVATITESIEAKLSLIPRTRQIVREVPFWLGRPVWIDAPRFQASDHVMGATVPGTGDAARFHALIGWLMSTKLDRNRPLWKIWVVGGLESGHWALVLKIHHCMLDGIAGMDLMTVLLDKSASPTKIAPEPWLPGAPPRPLRLLATAAASMTARPDAVARGLANIVRRPREATRRALADVHGLIGYARLARPAPHSSLLGALGAQRSWACTRVDIGEVAAVRSALGGTINDVVLTAITRGYRDLLLGRGEQPSAHSVRTLVPVSLRTADQHDHPDNKVTAMVAELPVSVADPVERFHAVRTELDRLKHSGEPFAGHLLTDMAYVAPPVLFNLAASAAFQIPQRAVVTVTTNVPGPRIPLYAAGRRLRELYPYVPIAYRLRIGVALTSYDGVIFFGVTADRDSTPDIAVVTEGIEAGLRELLAAASQVALQSPPVPA